MANIGPHFFSKGGSSGPAPKKSKTSYVESEIVVDPKDQSSLKNFQRHIENDEGPFYLNPSEIRTQPLDSPLKIYHIAAHSRTAAKGRKKLAR